MAWGLLWVLLPLYLLACGQWSLLNLSKALLSSFNAPWNGIIQTETQIPQSPVGCFLFALHLELVCSHEYEVSLIKSPCPCLIMCELTLRLWYLKAKRKDGQECFLAQTLGIALQIKCVYASASFVCVCVWVCVWSIHISPSKKIYIQGLEIEYCISIFRLG